MIGLRVERGGSVLLDRRLTVSGPRGVRVDDVVPRSGPRPSRFTVTVESDGTVLGQERFEVRSIERVVASVFADGVVWTTF